MEMYTGLQKKKKKKSCNLQRFKHLNTQTQYGPHEKQAFKKFIHQYANKVKNKSKL